MLGWTTCIRRPDDGYLDAVFQGNESLPRENRVDIFVAKVAPQDDRVGETFCDPEPGLDSTDFRLDSEPDGAANTEGVVVGVPYVGRCLVLDVCLV